MKISIITVVYNSVSTLEDTIISVASQRHADVEHLIVDGGSTDGTLAIIERHRDKLARFVSEPDKGLYDAMNKGLKLVTGELVGFLNADDIYADEGVLDQVAQVFSDPAVDACYADLVYITHDLTQTVRYWKSREYEDGLFEKGWMPAHPTFFVRRKVYEQFGGFDLAFPRQADFDLTMRFLAVHKIKSVYVPEIWVKMRVGGVSNNSVRGIVQGNLEAKRACQKNGLKVGLSFIFYKILSRVPQFFSRPK